MTEIDYKQIQQKWIKRWKERDIFKATPDENKQKYYLTVAYPYPSGSMHVGHGRTYTVPDVIARFKRMQGYNVLFPMAWHVTGSPVLGIAKRIEKNDPDTMRIYGDIYKVPGDVLETFKNPKNIVKYFSDEYQENMQTLGYTIDWSRKFLTITPQYSKFITWQYHKLYEKGYIRKGKHPVRYCPGCDNPVGDHDLLAGESAQLNEFYILKFTLNLNSFDNSNSEEIILPAATLRPETIFGVTNMWLNPGVVYLKVKIEGEIWLLSRQAFEKLRYQGWDVEICGEIPGADLIGKNCTDPVNNREIPILPASFVDPDYATGVVMSVPAHAPYDYAALSDLGSKIEAVTIIHTKKYDQKYETKKESPAQQLVVSMGITSQDDPKLERATEQMYRDEHSKGIMSKEIQIYGGISVSQARKRLIEDMDLKIFYEFSQYPIKCRCGTGVVVKILEDQWFVRYSDDNWKKQTHECLKNVEIVPSELKVNFEHVIDWLDDWACTRRAGFGTRFPYDDKWLIEPLSDSTIYMAYYTISRYLSEIPAENLNDNFFDYVFLGAGDKDEAAASCGIETVQLDQIRSEFNYWYPGDWRFSAKDLVGNHLTFHLFHHTAIFPKDKLPKGIVVFGIGLLDGSKMSSSKGNVILLDDAITKYGSDTVRLFLMSNADPWQDFDWRDELVFGVHKKLKQFYELTSYALGLKTESNNPGEFLNIDRWLLSRMSRLSNLAGCALDNFQTRSALQSCFFQMINDVNWYMRRCRFMDREDKVNPEVLQEFSVNWIKLMTPFTPFTCEQLWEMLPDEKKDSEFAATSSYPELAGKFIDEKVEIQEDVILKLLDVLRNVISISKIKPRKIYLYIAPGWMRNLYEMIADGKRLNEVMQDAGMKAHAKDVARIMKKTFRRDVGVVLAADEESGTLEDAKGFISAEFGCDVVVQKIDGEIYDPENKAGYALPMRPGVYVE